MSRPSLRFRYTGLHLGENVEPVMLAVLAVVRRWIRAATRGLRSIAAGSETMGSRRPNNVRNGVERDLFRQCSWCSELMP